MVGKSPSLESIASSTPQGTTNHEKLKDEVIITSDSDPERSLNETPKVIPVPLKWKLASILMVSAIGFGSNWSSGITGAMKTTIKKGMKINNTQFALLEASEDFMVTALMLVSGLVTDRIGGAGELLSNECFVD